MLSLRSDLGSREFKDVKVIIFWRGKALYLYSTAITIQGLQRKPREGLDRLEDDSEAFGKFPVPEGTFGKSFQRLLKLW